MKIFVVEDDPVSALILRRALARLGPRRPRSIRSAHRTASTDLGGSSKALEHARRSSKAALSRRL